MNLNMEALKWWNQMSKKAEFGQLVEDQIGTMKGVLSEEQQQLEEYITACEESGMGDFEILSVSQAHDRWRRLQLNHGQFLFSKQGGFIYSHKTQQIYQELAVKNGVHIKQDAWMLEEWEDRGSHFNFRFTNAQGDTKLHFDAEQVVFEASDEFLQQQLQQFGLQASVQRNTFYQIQYEGLDPIQLQQLPLWSHTLVHNFKDEPPKTRKSYGYPMIGKYVTLGTLLQSQQIPVVQQNDVRGSSSEGDTDDSFTKQIWDYQNAYLDENDRNLWQNLLVGSIQALSVQFSQRIVRQEQILQQLYPFVCSYPGKELGRMMVTCQSSSIQDYPSVCVQAAPIIGDIVEKSISQVSIPNQDFKIILNENQKLVDTLQ
eukprot:TRINITY_DN6391_c0_g1_i1.p1 TRINITY_DN6391_c0_g1~~TRINITY_DN6391_c0_g1_i1.p1  ORF type:complete len:397 (-),score=46.51 TRINITY_DN6391_c0_g1_i1:90-1205(-)